jgi:3-methylfumaryl-CoA hydratase
MSALSSATVEAWRAYIGRTRTQRQVIDCDVLLRFAAATGSDLDVERNPPPLAHWAFFIDTVPPERIGEDGHPLRGDFLPPVTLPRRMFAASSMQFEGALDPGQPAECVSTIADLVHKSGKSGDLVFLELDRVISQAGTLRIRERQTIVYRGAGAAMPPVVPAETPSSGTLWHPGPVDLFRFSAVTFNSHRIHYDLPYARDVEGYPGLVVHGPFTAVKLFTFAQEHAGRPIRSFSFRAIAPLIVSQPIALKDDAEPDSVCAVRCDGVIAMKANVGL